MGRGIITVSTELFERQEPQKSMNGKFIDVGEPIKQPQTLAEWKTLLMLPDELRLLEAKLDATYPCWWNITVEHEAIPTVESKQIEVVPIFTRGYNEEDGTSTTYLERIDLRIPTDESPMEAIKNLKDAATVSSLIEKRNPVIWQREESLDDNGA